MKSGGVQYVPDVDVVFAQAMLLPRNMDGEGAGEGIFTGRVQIRPLLATSGTTRQKMESYTPTQGLFYKRAFRLRPHSILQARCFCGFTTMYYSK